ncbi:hypothetical protein NHQ30_004406 [Ciborinia camelliae]|nr:hypothetical protein NHQ30_004406 [Ciborinia camelliae]
MDQNSPLRSVSDPFRFNDLPTEIRQKIYKILLCTVEDPPENFRDENGCTYIPMRITKLQHDIHPQILRTCRKINDEATFTMRKTNLLVMVTGVIRLDEPRNCFVSRCIPMIRIKNENQARNFRKSCVMTHDIYDSSQHSPVLPHEPYKFMLLHRHLPRFCAALVISALGTIPYCDETLVPHIVTILDPYDKVKSDSFSFMSQELQEKLVAPYRSEFKGFQGFQLEGHMQKDLKNAIMSEILWGPQLNHEAILQDLENMQAKGDECFYLGYYETANEIWCQALMSIRRILTVSKRQISHAIGEPEFMNQIMNIYFDLSSNRAQYIINEMQTCGPQQRRILLRVFLHIIDDPENIKRECKLSTWAPPQDKLAEFRDREYIGYRLGGVIQA